MKISNRERNEIIMEFLPKINYIVQSLKQENLPPTVTEEDLINTGVLGLIDAINKYDPSKGVKLSTYAEIRIRGQIIDSLRKLDWVPRNVRQKARHIEAAILEVEQKLGREATPEEIAEYLGMDVEEYMKYAEKISNSGLISIDTTVGSDEDANTKLWQIISINDDTPDKYVEEEELKKIISDIISKLNERERLVITLYYYEELSMKEIGEVLGLTESRISQIHTKTMMKIKSMIKKYISKE
ncbi:MAG TPA: FliA/WhiG family RNA polymerase sigma factor [Persephonella sp.]|uniref:RNA polymerase sigma-D factor (Sigma-28) n=1 Tax=Persephonella marina (strain DSM 14350 / EX-H1) TaxID=123214 RepID=C0QR72_PERMH|nr:MULTISPECIES: FliA/WhiG family RNA polymerase sigma factor [Persephonella]ACO03976.1 RNA polymerase sigma-D factor (Sigma-28) [Persephonella marina EX-H1]HCB68915.1 FliA/WhiG family RNA polymerase sigma factor [Persephonella sp.]